MNVQPRRAVSQGELREVVNRYIVLFCVLFCVLPPTQDVSGVCLHDVSIVQEVQKVLVRTSKSTAPKHVEHMTSLFHKPSQKT